MSGRKIKLLVNNNNKIIPNESYKDKLTNQLRRYEMSEPAIKRYITIMSYSNQVDTMYIPFLANIISTMYFNNEMIDGVGMNVIAGRSIGKRENYSSDQDYKDAFQKMLMTTIRYIKHFNDCKARAEAQGLENINFDEEYYEREEWF